MLLRQRDVQSVVRGGSLQFEIKTAAEPLAQRESPRLVNAAPKRRVDYKLHPAPFIEKPLGYDGVLRGNRTQHRPPLQNVFSHLLGAGVI